MCLTFVPWYLILQLCYSFSEANILVYVKFSVSEFVAIIEECNAANRTSLTVTSLNQYLKHAQCGWGVFYYRYNAHAVL